jgi:2-polyprenyl-3-methyl-5-hydroxy-6-metoxy-1,4-benzoquinol methylase
MTETYTCPNCHAPGMSIFYEVARAPVHSVLLMETAAQARTYPTGEIALGVCAVCGFIANVKFNPALHDYSAAYEATQSYSPTFTQFNRGVAQRLIDRYDLRHKTVIEIGCGHGEFLILLCEMGPNRGIGFDPTYIEERIQHPAKERITFIRDYYSEKYGAYRGDFVCCKMTLEHIPATAEFVQTVRRSIGDNLDTVVFFQVPNAGYVLRDVAFWDVYYEHCSYFTAASLAYLFWQSGFEVLDVAAEYDDQYLMLEARPLAQPQRQRLADLRDEIAQTQQAVTRFAAQATATRARWRAYLDDQQAQGKKVIIWGSGSKGVAFLTTLGIDEQIAYVVDINPHRHGTFMAGTGHEIVSPAFLQTFRPDLVIVMNPVYAAEIQRDLDVLGLRPELLNIDLFSKEPE